MRRRVAELDDGRRKFSPHFASLCALAALAVALVAFRFGSRLSPEPVGYRLDHLEDASMFAPEHGILVKHVGGSRSTFQRQDESDLTDFSIEDFVRRADVISPGKPGAVSVLLLITDETKAGEFTKTIEELKAVGVRSFAIASYEEPD